MTQTRPLTPGRAGDFVVTVFGPNLRTAAEQMHVHSPGCRDTHFYGPGRKYGGDDRGWTLHVHDLDELATELWGDIASDHAEPGSPEWLQTCRDYMSDVKIFPCVELTGERVR